MCIVEKCSQLGLLDYVLFFFCKVICGSLYIYRIMSLSKHTCVVILSHTLKDTHCFTLYYLSTLSCDCIVYCDWGIVWNGLIHVLYSVWQVPRPVANMGEWKLVMCTSWFDMHVMTTG